MAKRFTDTDKWKKKFLKGLQAPYKLLWFYILDDCDHAGIWHVDLEVASLRIGEKLTEKKAIEFFSKKVFIFDEGEKWFIPDFITFQYGELNPNNRAHNSAINLLNKYKLINENKELISPLEGVKDKDKVKDMDMDKELVKEKEEIIIEKPKEKLFPEMQKAFCDYYEYKTESKYIWMKARDTKNMKLIMEYLEIHLKANNIEINNDNSILNFKVILNNISDDWILNNLSVGIIQTQFNKITKKVTPNGKSDKQSKREARLTDIKNRYEEAKRSGSSELQT